MSNYPPPPPGQPQQQPQGQYPQQGQPYPQPMPGQPYPGYQMPGAMQPRKTSGAAITSLVCGLLFCIPGLTGLVAVITGFIGIKSTSRPNVGGRGMAITGLILGFLSLGGWAVAGYAIYGVTKQAIAVAQDGKAFSNAVIAGDLTGAKQFTTSSFTDDSLKQLQTQLSSWGTLNDLQVASWNQSATLGGSSFVITGNAVFSQGGRKTFNLTVVKQNDKWKIDSLTFQ